ncbi:MAG TPA: efflux RND transporter permease subunit [Caulobacteraceae bacterium]|jgi:multidrug efflux pump|nr:efflux RND transporter permease subunit [Caulobacteraceae bacterium]
MNLSAPFIRRPVATILLTLGISLAGAAAFFMLPVAALPSVDLPTITVQANLPGASPQIMATSVATPLERRLGQIADVSEMTSSSGVGQTRITLQFGMNRNIDGAARDVQAAINASRADLPATLNNNPTYRKQNPADQPILTLALTSETMSTQQIYDAADTILGQKILQVQGVGDVAIGGGASPAVRVEMNLPALARYGISSEDVRAAIASANANAPKGQVEINGRRLQIYANDQGKTAKDYAPLIIAYRNGGPVRLTDVAQVVDGPVSLYNMGLFNGRPSVVMQITRQPGANIVAVVDRVKALLPQLRAELPPKVTLDVASDRTLTIRASLKEVEHTLMISVVLVVIVVLLFLHNGKATLIPAVAVVVSLLGALIMMFLLGFSLDNLSLMALTVATGFVVDDAIVVLENITRHVEAGMPRMKAALLGAKEVGFTVVSMSISLIAVFIPILMMGGIVGLYFREFAITLSAAILFSLIISLSTTPMMAAYLIEERHKEAGPRRGPLGLWDRFARAWERGFENLVRSYENALDWALGHGLIMMAILAAIVALNVYMYTAVPKGFFPQQDTGTLQGFAQVDQASSFELTSQKFRRLAGVIQRDPAVDTVTGFVGGAGGGLNVQLKPKAERKLSSDQVSQRLRPALSRVPGAQVFLQVPQDIRVGGRQANAQYQYTLESDDLTALRTWTQKLTDQLRLSPALTDVNNDQQDRGLETYLTIDRDSAARLGITNQTIDNTLYNAFGQRNVATIYNELNQYRVVMEADPKYGRSPTALGDLYVASTGTANTAGGAGVLKTTTGGGGANQAQTGAAVATTVRPTVPLSAISRYTLAMTPTAVNHQGQAVAATISFNMAVGRALSDAQAAVADAQNAIAMPGTVVGHFRGTAQVFEQSLASEPILILSALVAVYLVLGILYESYIHPLTVLSTLPSAGVGAVAALMIFRIQFDIIGLIGIILLIGIVKKNAIMMIDFALVRERDHGLDSRAAIREAALLRFRPILMTTCAAILGALPLAFGLGEGGELRRPLGVTIIGGLVASQLLTLLTTPVVYVYLDKLRKRRPSPDPKPRKRGWRPGGEPAFGPAAAPSKD